MPMRKNVEKAVLSLLIFLAMVAAETTDDSTDLILNESNLVFGVMGVGTFLIAFLSIVVLVLFAITTHCGAQERFDVRKWAVVVWIIVVLILIFAQRQSQYSTGGYERLIYDESIVPRILLVLIMGIFTYLGIERLVIYVLGENILVRVPDVLYFLSCTVYVVSSFTHRLTYSSSLFIFSVPRSLLCHVMWYRY